MSENSSNKPPIWFWIVSVLGLVWNGMGVNAYLQQAYNTESFRAMYSPEQLEIVANQPAWLTGVFAVAVFAGALGCLALLLRKKLAVTLMLLSLLAVIIQMGYVLINNQQSDMIMTLMIIVFAFFLVWFSRKSASNGWIS
jgi:hypothetical protein